MENNDEKNADKIILNSTIQFGTYYLTFLGTMIAIHVHDYLKSKEPKSAEA